MAMTPRISWQRRRWVAVACMVNVCFVAAAGATSVWWDGSTGNSWAATGNWSTAIGGGADPSAVPGSGDAVIFNADGAIPVQLGTLGGVDQAAQSLTFRANTTTAITLGAGNTLGIYSGNITAENGAASHTLNPVLSLGDPGVGSGAFAATFANAAAGNLKIGGNVVAANAGATWALTVDGGQTTEFIAAAAQTQPFTATTIQNGSTLQMTGAFATGNYSFGAGGSTITLTGNGRFRLGSSSSANPLTLQNAWAIGTGGGRIETYRSGNPNERYVFSGATTLGGNLSISIGAGTTTSQWSGSLDLTGGNRSVSVVQTSNNGYLATLSGNITQDAPGRTLTLATGSTTGATAGRTILLSGANTVDNVATAVPAAPAATTGNIRFNALSAYPAASLTIASGTFAGLGFTSDPDVTAALGRIAAGSTGVLGIDANIGSDIDLSGSGLNRDLRLGSSTTAAYTGTLTPYDGAPYKVGGGGGTLTFSNANAFTGTRNLDVATEGTLSGGTIVLSNGNDFVGSIAVGAGMVLQANSNAALGSAANSLALTGNFVANIGTDTIARTITGAGSITKSNIAGTLTFDGDMSGWTGALIVNGGTVKFGDSATGPSGIGLVTLANVASTSLDLNGRNITLAGLTSGGGTGGNVINSSATASTLTLNPTGTQTYVGSITSVGTIHLVMTGTQVQKFQGNNTYTGATTLTGGTLELSGGAAAGKLSGTTAVTVCGGGILQNGSGTAADNSAARINNNAASLTLGDTVLGGGTYTFGLTTAGGGLIQQHTALTVAPGLSSINARAAGTVPATLQFTGARTMNMGGVVNELPAANFVLQLNEPSVSHLGPAFIVGYNGANTGDWGATDGAGLVSAMGAAAQNVDPDSWVAGSDVNVTAAGAYTLDASRSINSLRMVAANSFTLNIGLGQALTVSNGGVLINGSSGNSIGGGGTLAAGGDLYLYGNPVANQGVSVDAVLSAGAGNGALILLGGGQGSGITGGQAAFALKRPNEFDDLYVLYQGVESRIAGSLGTGTIHLIGGGLSVNTVAQTIANPVSVCGLGAFLGAGNVVATLTGNLATSAGTLTVGAAYGDSNGTVANGLVYVNPGTNATVSGAANVSINSSGLAASTTAALPGGNLKINGGVLVLDGRTSGKDIFSYADLTGARAYGAGAGQWQLTAGGFAARGATLSLDLSGVNLNFDRNFTLGLTARDAAGAFFANAGVNVTQSIALTADRTVNIAPQGVGLGRPPAQAVVQRISGNITGAFNPIFHASPQGSTALGVAELVLSGSTNRWTGSRAFVNVNTGIGGLGAADGSNGLFIRFDDTGLAAGQTSVPTGGGANPAFLASINQNNGNSGGFFFTGSTNGTTYYLSNAPAEHPARNLRMLLGTTDGNNRINFFGSTGGAATLVGAPILVWSGSTASQAQDVGLIVRDGTFTLGGVGAGHAVSFVPAYKAANDAQPDFTNVGDAAGGTRTVMKLGVGTVILGNVAYTRKDLSTDASSLCAWSLGSIAAAQGSVGQAAGAFAGAVRETGSSATTSLSGVRTYMNGGVIEFADTPRSITLAGTPTAGQISMNGTGGGGFAAVGGDRTLTIGSGTLEWENNYVVTGFLRNYQPLIFGSPTADSTLTLANNLNLHVLRQTIATVRGVGDAPEGEITGSLSNGSLIVAGMRRPDGTPLAAGTLVLSGVSTYAGETHVTNGTLIVNGALTTSASPVRVNAGAALGGTGTVSRAVMVADGGTLAAGSRGVGTLRTGALTLSDRSTNRVDLASGGADVIAVTGNLTLDGTIVPVLGAGFKSGKNLIMTYTGTLTDNGVTVAPPNLPTAGAPKLLVDPDAKEVYLVLRQPSIVVTVR